MMKTSQGQNFTGDVKIDGPLQIDGPAKINDISGLEVVLDRVVYFPGNHAMATIDFNAVGTATMTITINGVVYTEADTAVPASGIWTNGASAADSATSLIAALNGDTRAVVPFTAIADVSGDGVIIVWDAVGTAGNVTIASSTGDATTANSLLGENAAIKKSANITKTITTNELLAGASTIPLPFAPSGFTFNCVSATGAPILTTDLLTIETAPNRILITTTGGTTLANTDVVHLTAWE